MIIKNTGDKTEYSAMRANQENVMYILLADGISGISSSQLRAVYCVGCLLRHSVSGGEEPKPTTNIPRTRTK
jgi:hypothetical protein